MDFSSISGAGLAALAAAGVVDFPTTVRLARERGIFVGPSSGANYWAARKIKQDNPSIKNVLTFLCDRGEKYLSLMYS